MTFNKIHAGLYWVLDEDRKLGKVEMVNETLWLARSTDGKTKTTGRTRYEAGKQLVKAVEEVAK